MRIAEVGGERERERAIYLVRVSVDFFWSKKSCAVREFVTKTPKSVSE